MSVRINRPFLSIVFCIFCYLANNAQETSRFFIQRKANVVVNEIQIDYNPRLQNLEMPSPTKKMDKGDFAQHKTESDKSSFTPSLDSIGVVRYFLANSFNMSTPCDNDLAISNSGKMISVMNTNLYFYDIYADSTTGTVSLSAFFSPLGLTNQEFDPKVVYDPEANKFIIVALNGFVDSTSCVLLAFSETEDPTGNWNLYTLPGDPTNDTLWSDYPIIAVNNEELFITLNLLSNDSTWQAGFKETIIWQLGKEEGYLGQSLNANLINAITFQGSPLMNLCPIKGGDGLKKGKQYFLSNRNFSPQNDSVFIITINDTIGSPLYAIDVQLALQSRMYGFPPDANQNNGTFLATNDSRILSGFIQNDRIQYVHNSIDVATGNCGVFYGIIENVSTGNYSLSGEIISDSIMDFGYPNISYAGLDSSDNSAIISFDHVSPINMPGISALKTNGEGDFSPISLIRNGSCFVNLLTGNIDRWGDYSGSQRKYDQPGVVWVSGYFGRQSGLYKAHCAIIAELNYFQPPISYEEYDISFDANIFPNPTSDLIVTEFNLTEAEYLDFFITDSNGKMVKLLMSEFAKPGKNSFSFSIDAFAPGIYYLTIVGKKNHLQTKMFVKN